MTCKNDECTCQGARSFNEVVANRARRYLPGEHLLGDGTTTVFPPVRAGGSTDFIIEWTALEAATVAFERDPQFLVEQFHKKFGHPVAAEPVMLSKERAWKRYEWILEELDEFGNAVEGGDLVEAVDAIGDMLYLVYGTAVEMGVDIEPVFRAIHAANMDKIPAENPLDKVRKPEGWVAPQERIKVILEEQAQ